MIKMHIDLADVSAAELTAFYEIPGMKEAIGALSTRGRELNVTLTMTGGEGAVASLMSDIAPKLSPHIESDEYHKVGSFDSRKMRVSTPISGTWPKFGNAPVALEE
jgi:hypothetical protein